MILLVEDEERAREVFARILRKAGYAVIEAGDTNYGGDRLDCR